MHTTHRTPINAHDFDAGDDPALDDDYIHPNNVIPRGWAPSPDLDPTSGPSTHIDHIQAHYMTREEILTWAHTTHPGQTIFVYNREFGSYRSRVLTVTPGDQVPTVVIQGLSGNPHEATSDLYNNLTSQAVMDGLGVIA